MPLVCNIPLSLYIHLPWCVKKCPYCDFNSFKQNGIIPEEAYINALLKDLSQELPKMTNRQISSIFIGGGTPSLFSAESISRLLKEINNLVDIVPNVEITMEANPGTFEQERFAGFRAAGINRLSLGIQSFNATHLKILGRIHGQAESLTAATAAKQIGFSKINLDLMYALPNQTIEEALVDLQQAIALSPTHLSWYHLTIEPNTAFYRQPPKVPVDDIVDEMEMLGEALLEKHHFSHYEVSAFCQDEQQCVHNLNYWQFGDYLGIGAGAHSKITLPDENKVLRFWKQRVPHQYLNPVENFTSNQRVIEKEDLILEFMLNALRLADGFSINLFETRTGLNFTDIEKPCDNALRKGLITLQNHQITPTLQGKRFLNDLMGLFLPTTQNN